MDKESFLALKICDRVVKYGIYTAMALIPIFFLPWTSEVLDFNKQAVMLTLLFISLFGWMLKVLISSKLETRHTIINSVVGVSFLSCLLATIFSVSRYGSFWGWPQITSESLFSVMGFCILYFLVSNTFSAKNVLISIYTISVSALIAEIFGVLQLFALFTLPFDFAKTISFNTIGAPGALGFFAAILLPIAFSMMIITKKWWRFLFGLIIFFSALILFLIDYPIIWWAVALGSGVILILGATKRNIFDGRWMALPVFFLAVSVFFLILNPQVNLTGKKPNEIFLSQDASLKLSLQALKEKPLVGSGPGTYFYDFSKFKEADFSKSALWNLTFNKGTSRITNDLANTGLLGVIALLVLMISSVFVGVRALFSKNQTEERGKKSLVLIMGLTSALITEALMYFLYNSNVVLEFTYFFILGALIVLVVERKKEYELKASSLPALITTIVFTVLFIFGLGLLFLNGQRYIAEMNYLNSLSSWQASNLDQGIKEMEAAASLNSSSDLYYRQLSQIYLGRLQTELKNYGDKVPTEEERNKVQALVMSSINASKTATDLNPKNVTNWSIRGYIYQNMFGLVGDAEKWALNSYDKAIELDPNNPYLLAQKGIVFYNASTKMTINEAAQKTENLTKAKDQLEKAVELNPTYSNALYYLGLVYDGLGDKNKAIEKFSIVSQLNTQNTDIIKILDNLRAGRSAFEEASSAPILPLVETSKEGDKEKAK